MLHFFAVLSHSNQQPVPRSLFGSLEVSNCSTVSSEWWPEVALCALDGVFGPLAGALGFVFFNVFFAYMFCP